MLSDATQSDCLHNGCLESVEWNGTLEWNTGMTQFVFYNHFAI